MPSLVVKSKVFWVADSGATSHMVSDLSLLLDVKKVDQRVTVGDGNKVGGTYEGTFKGTISQEDGTTQDVTLSKVLFVLGLYANLFSLTKAIEHGCTLGNEGERMFIQKGDFHLTFDRFV